MGLPSLQSAPGPGTWAKLRELAPSSRVLRLRERFEAEYAACGQRRLTDPEEVAAVGEAILDAYRATPDEPAIVRRARALSKIAEHAVVRHDPEGLLAGSQRFNGLFASEVRAELAELGYATTTGHIVHDYAGLLRHGVKGYREAIGAALARAREKEARTNLHTFDEAMQAFARFIARHGETVAPLAERAPRSFAEALQLVWLMQVFLHAENPGVAAVSFGRMDQYLWPFLREDQAEGRTTLQEVFDLLCAFLLKCHEGEESQNVVVGGVDEEGREATNPLSLLLLASARSMRAFQPSFTVRVHPEGNPELLAAACDLAAAGLGQPGFMNDPVVTAGLQAVGIPLERARDWAIIGCYEAAPQGDTYPNTVLARLHLVEDLAAFLASAPAREARTFAHFLAGWREHVQETYAGVLAGAQAQWNRMRDLAPSPFGSVLLGGCRESGRPLEAGGARFNLVGVNILGLGTLVDSLHVLRELAFERRELSVTEIAEAVAADFPEEGLRLRVRAVPGRYGTDSPATNALAAEVSGLLAEMVLASRMEGGVRPYPACFSFSSDIYALGTASPDGRRANDLISYGVAPGGGVEAAATSVLRSAAHVAHDRCACGNPLALALQRSDLAGPSGARLIRDLVQTYFALGGQHLHFNVISAEDLRAAQADPEQWASLTVRVSGYSARFVTVDPRWQEALIQRAEEGR